MVKMDSLKHDIVALTPRLKKFAIQLTRNIHDADDLIQNTLVAAFGAIDRYSEDGSLSAWLHAIMRNRYLSDYNTKRRRRTDCTDNDSYLESIGGYISGGQEESIYLKEVIAHLKTIKPNYRKALVQRHVHGLSHEDLAAMFDTEVGTVKSRISRGREKLMEIEKY